MRSFMALLVPEVLTELEKVDSPVFEKTRFSMLTDDVRGFLESKGTQSAILVGIEVRYCGGFRKRACLCD